MSIFNKADKMFVGSGAVKKIYMGAVQIWEACYNVNWVSEKIATWPPSAPTCSSTHKVTKGCKYTIVVTGRISKNVHYGGGGLKLSDNVGTVHETHTKIKHGNRLGFTKTFVARGTYLKLCSYDGAGTSAFGQVQSLKLVDTL